MFTEFLLTLKLNKCKKIKTSNFNRDSDSPSQSILKRELMELFNQEIDFKTNISQETDFKTNKAGKEIRSYTARAGQRR
jgi:hypothetical protein